ncbi:MAG: hypothetical protein J07AB43_06510 [Candidatus Nanosalina sp. J07AB43]|jgi:hypothetical protein|nr:MAG: hypothetical protein J07AB43_06510 [Candidatus Nanosalina sp. J07AB43]
MVDIEYEDDSELERKLYEAMDASNYDQGLGYSDETLEEAAEQLVPILSAGDHQPSYDEIDRWLEEAHSEKADLSAGVKLRAIEEYSIPSDP